MSSINCKHTILNFTTHIGLVVLFLVTANTSLAQTINSFALVDVNRTNDDQIFVIPGFENIEGQINLSDLEANFDIDASKLSIQIGYTNPNSTITSFKSTLVINGGPQEVFTTGPVAPAYVFHESNDLPLARKFELGKYELLVEALNASNEVVDSKKEIFNVVRSVSINTLTLLNTSTGNEISISEGQEISIAEFEEVSNALSIVAQTSDPELTDGVTFAIEGPDSTFTLTDSDGPPFTLFGKDDSENIIGGNLSIGDYTLSVSPVQSDFIQPIETTLTFTLSDRLRIVEYLLTSANIFEDTTLVDGINIDAGTDTSRKEIISIIRDPGNTLEEVRFELVREFPTDSFDTTFVTIPRLETNRYILSPDHFPNVGTYTLTTKPVLLGNQEDPSLVETISFIVNGSVSLDGFTLTSQRSNRPGKPISSDQTIVLSDSLYSQIDTSTTDIVAQISGFSDIISSIQFDLYTEPPGGGIEALCSPVDTMRVYRLFDTPSDCSSDRLKLDQRYWLETKIIPQQTDVDIQFTDTSLANFGIIEEVKILEFQLVDESDSTKYRSIHPDETLDLVVLDGLDFNIEQLNIRAALNVPEQDPLVEGVTFQITLPLNENQTPIENCFGENTLSPSGTSRKLLSSPGTLCYGTYMLTATLQGPDLNSDPVSFPFTLDGPRVESFSFVQNFDNGEPPIIGEPILVNDTLNIRTLEGDLNIKINSSDTQQPRIKDIIIALTTPENIDDTDVIPFPPGQQHDSLPDNVFTNNWPSDQQSNGKYRLSLTYEVDEINYTNSVDFFLENALPNIRATGSILVDNQNKAVEDTIDVTTIQGDITLTININATATIDRARAIYRFDFEPDSTLIDSTLITRPESGQPTQTVLSLDLSPANSISFTKGKLYIDIEIFHPQFPNDVNLVPLTYELEGPRIVSYALIDGISSEVHSEITGNSTVLNQNDLPENPILQARLKDPRGTIKRIEFLSSRLEVPADNQIEERTINGSITRVAESPINFVSDGQYEIEARWGATEFNGQYGSDLLKFRLDSPPIISSTNGFATSQNQITVTTTIVDSEVITPTIHYRFAGDPCLYFSEEGCFASIPLDSTTLNDTYSIELSRFTGTASRNIEYYIQAQDEFGFVARDPRDTTKIKSIEIPFEGTGIIKTTTQPAAFQGNNITATAYRLISIPLDLDSKTVRSVLIDDLGEANNTQWLLTEPHTLLDVSESNEPIFEPGSAFWLITRDSVNNIDSGGGNTITTDKPFNISIEQRTNNNFSYFGNPFNFSIPYENISRADGNTNEIQLYRYDGQWKPISEDPVLRPFEGYAMENSAQTDSLLIDPIIRNSSNSANNPPPDSLNTNKNREESWELRISARKKYALDSYNYASVRPAASEDWGSEDWSEPPLIGEYVSLYFSHPEWGAHREKFSKDVRPPSQDGGYVWPIEVISSKPDIVTLSLVDISTLPDIYDPVIYDPILGISQSLREKPEYTFRGATEPRSFTLIVGDKAFIEAQNLTEDFIPTTYELHPNFPNPFSTSTTIRYGLPASDRVDLEIYNLLGQRVAVIEEGADREAGYHAVIWDGRGMAGEVLGSGVYFARMKSSQFSETIKLVIVH